MKILKLWPLRPRAFSYGLKHLSLGWARALQRQPVTRFTQQYKQLGLPVEAVQRDGQPICCHLCGYAIASVSFDCGWTAEMCSATQLSTAFAANGLDAWKQQLEATQLTGVAAPSLPSLQGPGQ